MKYKIDKKLIATIAIGLFACVACSQQDSQETSHHHTSHSAAEEKDTFYHYSIWYAFVNKVFEGHLTVDELKHQGDIGLGSYNHLDGELIMLDGVAYQAKEDGSVTVAADQEKIVYANATFFDSQSEFTLNKKLDYPSLRQEINTQLPSKNLFYGFKITGTFNHIKLGGLHKQHPPYDEGLDSLLPKRPIFEGENVTGTLVGFYCPEFIGNINVAGYHLHFISDDKKLGGHLLSFDSDQLNVQIDEILDYHFVLPDTKAYRQVGFEKEFQYKKH